MTRFRRNHKINFNINCASSSIFQNLFTHHIFIGGISFPGRSEFRTQLDPHPPLTHCSSPFCHILAVSKFLLLSFLLLALCIFITFLRILHDLLCLSLFVPIILLPSLFSLWQLSASIYTNTSSPLSTFLIGNILTPNPDIGPVEAFRAGVFHKETNITINPFITRSIIFSPSGPPPSLPF